MSESEKPLILRRLKTKDGLTSSIEVMHGYRYEELRVCDGMTAAFEISERLEKDDGTGFFVKYRRYVQRRTVQAILIEMEEQ